MSGESLHRLKSLWGDDHVAVCRCVALAAALLCAAGMMNGCQRVLFPEDAPRTQFESHDRLRNRSAPIEEVDEFGRPQPALRARLSPTQT